MNDRKQSPPAWLVGMDIDRATIERAASGSLEDHRKLIVLCSPYPLRAREAPHWPRDEDFIRQLYRFMEIFTQIDSDCDWTKRLGYDFCTNLARDFIWCGQPLPHRLDQFVIGVLDGKIKRTERGRQYSEFAYRDSVIATAVYNAVHVGDMTATRNKEKKGEHNSACDLVSVSLRKLGYHMEYGTVARIWENKASLFD